jgi:ABC-2 type transport system ATP-binding protein
MAGTRLRASATDINHIPAIRAERLTRRFRGTLAVDSLSFDVNPGTICGVVGPNGAGKSTTFRMICGLLRPSSGRVSILGRDVAKDTGAVPALAGLLPETPHFYPYLSGEQNLRVLAHASNLPQPNARVATLLKIAGLGDAASRVVSSYSAGMKQRLALAAALLTDPPVLILDEPTAGLDPTGALELRALIKTLTAEGRTVLMATQALDEAERMCTQLIVLSNGQLRANVQVAELLVPSGIRIRASPVEGALTVLRSLPAVPAVGIGADTIDVEPAEIPTAVLVRALVLGGVDITEVLARGVTLEQLFLILTGDAAAPSVVNR